MIPTKCVIGLDRDGVINPRFRNRMDVDMLHHQRIPSPIEGSLEAVAKIRQLGHRIVIITQPAVYKKV